MAPHIFGEKSAYYSKYTTKDRQFQRQSPHKSFYNNDAAALHNPYMGAAPAEKFEITTDVRYFVVAEAALFALVIFNRAGGNADGMVGLIRYKKRVRIGFITKAAAAEGLRICFP